MQSPSHSFLQINAMVHRQVQALLELVESCVRLPSECWLTEILVRTEIERVPERFNKPADHILCATPHPLYERFSISQVQPNSAKPAEAISIPLKTVKAHRLDANQYGISR
jgi:hypothetical protein